MRPYFKVFSIGAVLLIAGLQTAAGKSEHRARGTKEFGNDLPFLVSQCVEHVINGQEFDDAEFSRRGYIDGKVEWIDRKLLKMKSKNKDITKGKLFREKRRYISFTVSDIGCVFYTQREHLTNRTSTLILSSLFAQGFKIDGDSKQSNTIVNLKHGDQKFRFYGSISTESVIYELKVNKKEKK
jgi:hypothetical protein